MSKGRKIHKVGMKTWQISFLLLDPKANGAQLGHSSNDEHLSYPSRRLYTALCNPCEYKASC